MNTHAKKTTLPPVDGMTPEELARAASFMDKRTAFLKAKRIPKGLFKEALLGKDVIVRHAPNSGVLLCYFVTALGVGAVVSAIFTGLEGTLGFILLLGIPILTVLVLSSVLLYRVNRELSKKSLETLEQHFYSEAHAYYKYTAIREPEKSEYENLLDRLEKGGYATNELREAEAKRCLEAKE